MEVRNRSLALIHQIWYLTEIIFYFQSRSPSSIVKWNPISPPIHYYILKVLDIRVFSCYLSCSESSISIAICATGIIFSHLLILYSIWHWWIWYFQKPRQILSLSRKRCQLRIYLTSLRPYQILSLLRKDVNQEFIWRPYFPLLWALGWKPQLRL